MTLVQWVTNTFSVKANKELNLEEFLENDTGLFWTGLNLALPVTFC